MLDYQIRPIAVEEWLPDRCLRFSDPIDPKQVSPQSGCERLQAVFSKGERARLVALYEDIILRHGGCGFVAWQGDKVIGYLTFFPKNWAPTRPRGAEADPARDTLNHHCISIAESERFREEQLATDLMRRALDWAREQGWERYEVSEVYHDGLAFGNMIRRHRRGFWEKLGFHVIQETEPQGRFEVIRTVARWRGQELKTEADADAFYPAWRRDAIRYTMVCDL